MIHEDNLISKSQQCHAHTICLGAKNSFIGKISICWIFYGAVSQCNHILL